MPACTVRFTARYPRREDFNADLELFADSDAILGERLVVRYKYAHRAMPGKRHTPLDWVGLFKVISPSGALDSAVDAFHASTHSAVGTPASRRARQKEREERRRRGDGESKSGQTTPAQSVTTSPSRSLSPSRHLYVMCVMCVCVCVCVCVCLLYICTRCFSCYWKLVVAERW